MQDYPSFHRADGKSRRVGEYGYPSGLELERGRRREEEREGRRKREEGGGREVPA
jgi:hypothetical protein